MTAPATMLDDHRAAGARGRTRTDRGLRSGLKVPVQIDDRVVGGSRCSPGARRRIRRATWLTRSGSPTASRSGSLSAAGRSGPAAGVRAPALGRDRGVRRAAPDHLRTSSTSARCFPASRRSPGRCCRTTHWRWSSSIGTVITCARPRRRTTSPTRRSVTTKTPMPKEFIIADIDHRATAGVRTRGRVRAGHRGRISLVPGREAPGP